MQVVENASQVILPAKSYSTKMSHVYAVSNNEIAFACSCIQFEIFAQNLLWAVDVDTKAFSDT